MPQMIFYRLHLPLLSSFVTHSPNNIYRSKLPSYIVYITNIAHVTLFHCIFAFFGSPARERGAFLHSYCVYIVPNIPPTVTSYAPVIRFAVRFITDNGAVKLPESSRPLLLRINQHVSSNLT